MKLKCLSLILFLSFPALASNAQETDFSRLKEGMDANALPLVNIVTESALKSDSYVSGQIEISDFQKRTDPTRRDVQFRCEVKYRGASAMAYDKKSFAVKLLDSRGDDLDANVLGIREENSWILDAMAIDRIRMRNRLCFDIWNSMSHTPYDTGFDNRNGTDGVFVELFLNGEYEGLYCLSDKVDRKLLGLKKADKGTSGRVYIKGLLYKCTKWSGSSSYLTGYDTAPVNTTEWNAWELQYPSDYPSDVTWQPLMDLIDFCSQETTFAQFCDEYLNWFYVDNLVDYLVFTSALNVDDNFYKNTFLSTVDITKGHRYLITPWDMDMSLGGNYDGAYNDVTANLSRYDWRAPYNRLHLNNVDGFRKAVKDRWAELSPTLLSPDSVFARLDAYAAEFEKSGAWQREYDRWNGNPVPLKESLSQEIDYVKRWYADNYNSICREWGGAPYTSAPRYYDPNPERAIYLPDGRRVNMSRDAVPGKGLYIIDGKKIYNR